MEPYTYYVWWNGGVDNDPVLYGPFDARDAHHLVNSWGNFDAVLELARGRGWGIPTLYPYGLKDHGIDPKKYGQED